MPLLHALSVFPLTPAPLYSLLSLAADVAGEGFLHEVGFAAMVIVELHQKFFHLGAGGVDFGFVGGRKMLQAEQEFVERFFELVVVAEESLDFFGQGWHLFDGIGHVAVLFLEGHEAFQMALKGLRDETKAGKFARQVVGCRFPVEDGAEGADDVAERFVLDGGLFQVLLLLGHGGGARG